MIPTPEPDPCPNPFQILADDCYIHLYSVHEASDDMCR